MKINNKIPWGLAIGTSGITIAGAFNDTGLLGLESITGAALVLAKQQIEKKMLKLELAMELK